MSQAFSLRWVSSSPGEISVVCMAFALPGSARRSYMTLRTAAAMVVLLTLSSGCAARHGRPIIGGSTIPNPTGTISGTVTTTGGTPLEGRRVSAIDMATEQHYDVTTSNNGGEHANMPYAAVSP